MDQRESGQDARNDWQHLLGYLNFSSGAPDPKFLAGWNELYALLQPGESSDVASTAANGPRPVWARALERLEQELDRVQAEETAFADADQATAVLHLLKDHLISGYRDFHRDLLGYLSTDELLGPFMLGRMCEAILKQGPPWDESERIRDGAIAALNDYIGHRPVPTLASKRLEPHAHEWVRPLPVYIEGAGVAVGRYQEVISTAFELLGETDSELLEAAWFDPQELRELAIDPRAYDFDHPVNKRPNYHFGHWDPHCIDNRGRYRRFVMRKVTLDALMSRVENERQLPHEELNLEAASVLAGTILMASGISGWGPETHDSNTTLVSLIPRITAYRDAFYERLLDRLTGEHVIRLRNEARELQQPFGGARQHLNVEMSRRRARQLQRVKLAKLFARMGYADAAKRHTKVVEVSSARMLCDIDCCLTAAQFEIENEDFTAAADSLSQSLELVERGIDCGAIVDPWNILGFDCQFSLFPALENSVHDHRIDELVTSVERVFDLYSRLWCEAAASDDGAVEQRVSKQYGAAAQWWNQFAVHEVAMLEARPAMIRYEAAQRVAHALRDWHQAGEARGDVGFWAPRVQSFESPEPYALVIETLLDKRDFVSSLALLTHWLNQAETVGLQNAEGSFHDLAHRWLRQLLHDARTVDDEPGEEANNDQAWNRPWNWMRKFLDFLEANADQFGEVPQIDLGAGETIHTSDGELAADEDLDDDLDDEDHDLFSAAYENVVYKDSTDDGVESELFDTDNGRDDHIELETERVIEHLSFLSGQANLWTLASTALIRSNSPALSEAVANHRPEICKSMCHWFDRATGHRKGLIRLLEATEAHEILAPSGDHDSMVRYDRRRMWRETLIEQLTVCALSMRQAEQFLRAAILVFSEADELAEDAPAGEAGELDACFSRWLAGALRENTDGVEELSRELLSQLARRQILYVPVSKRGRVRKMLAARARQRMIERLLVWLPRLGLLTEARTAIDTARQMELNAHAGPGAITQFDELFEIGYREILYSVSYAFEQRQTESAANDMDDEALLVSCLETLTQSLLATWLSHSRTLRLSVLERVSSPSEWQKIVEFVKNYGADLFNQRFLNLANTRGILHQGIEAWLEQLEESGGDEVGRTLVESLDDRISYQDAADCLGVVLEAVVENYQEYRDYNSTTTQSDRGDQIYMLLDFLRLKMAYDRVVWNLRPILLTHETVVRRGHNEAAQMWRRALSERIREEADQYLKKLAELQRKYAMRMASVSDRINERFMRQMTIDRMRALVEPAITGRDEQVSHAFEILEEECALLMREPPGSGLDEPSWLVAIEQEVARVHSFGQEDDLLQGEDFAPSMAEIDVDDVQSQIDRWPSLAANDEDDPDEDDPDEDDLDDDDPDDDDLD